MVQEPAAEEIGYPPWRERLGMRILKAFLADVRGATAVEYGLMAALISAAVVGGLTTFGNSLQNTFNTVSNNLDSH
jgi:pilus assembly protein Flp/PilA